MRHKDTLSPREQEVVDLLLLGLSYVEIARRLIIERTTVITHIGRIYDKLNISNRWELMTMRIKELEDEIKKLKEERT